MIGINGTTFAERPIAVIFIIASSSILACGLFGQSQELIITSGIFQAQHLRTTESIGDGEPYVGYDSTCVDISPPTNCTSNDFTFIEAFLGSDVTGTPLALCDVGSATTGYFCFTFEKTNGSNRRGFYISTTIVDGDTSVFEVNHCFDETLRDQGFVTMCIPDEILTFTCGTQLQVLDAYFAWGSASASSNICDQTSGCADPKCDLIAGLSPLYTPLAADFTSSFLCAGPNTPYSVQFDDATSGGDAPYTYTWLFGDGDTSNLSDPLHIYPDTGSYDITLTVSDTSGLIASATKTVLVVDDSSEQVFSYSGCEGDGYGIEVNGTIYGESNPSDTVILSTRNGCDSMLIINLTFNPAAMVNAGMPSSPLCSDQEVPLLDLGASITGGASQGIWTSTGGGVFAPSNSFGGLNPALSYTPTTAEIDKGVIILTLTSDDPSGPCEPEADAVLVYINDLSCSVFPWAGG